MKCFKSMAALSLCLMACSPEASKVYMKPVEQKEAVTEDPNAQYFDPAVDILFVVDDSGSMDTHQRNLASNISLFTSKFSKNSVLDYNIGVITTDPDDYYYHDSGHLVGNVTVVNKSTLNGDRVLANNLIVGTNGSATEAVFDPVSTALSSQALSTFNKGFYRNNASLAVIFITDAEDQSQYNNATKLYQQLLTMKNQDAHKVLGYGVIVPSSVDDCPRDDSYTKPARIEEFLGLVQNGAQGQNIFNLCDQAFGDKLVGMAKDIVDQVGRVMYLNRVPDVNTIRVEYGSATLPMDAEKGWLFDPKKNAILLGDKIDWSSQPSGSRIMIHYETAQYQN